MIIGATLFNLIGIVFCVIIKLFKIILKYKYNQDVKFVRELISLSFCIYIILVIGVTLFPVCTVGTSYLRINYIPFKYLILQIKQLSQEEIEFVDKVRILISLNIRNFGGNIILFMPLGILLPILWTRFKKFKKCIIIGLLGSCTIEIFQLIEMKLGITSVRTLDIDDIILNIIGVMIGYLVYKSLFKVIFKKQN